LHHCLLPGSQSKLPQRLSSETDCGVVDGMDAVVEAPGMGSRRPRNRFPTADAAAEAFDALARRYHKRILMHA